MNHIEAEHMITTVIVVIVVVIVVIVIVIVVIGNGRLTQALQERCSSDSARK